MHTVTLHESKDETPFITTFHFTKPDEWSHVAGQFIELTVPHDDTDSRGDKRWFTMSSNPAEPTIAITTKRSEHMSSFKQALWRLKPGDAISLSEPMGDFVLPMQRSHPILFIAAGIGITPVRAIVTSADSSAHTMHALYITTPEQQVFTSELTAHTASLTLRPRRITNDEIMSEIAKLAEPYIYISGPEAFTENLFTYLRERVQKPNLIVTDYFHGYAE